MSLAANISASLGGAASGSGFLMKCCCHDDKNPSLSIKDTTNKNGETDVIVNCLAGCDWKDVKEKLTVMGLLPKFRPQKKREVEDLKRENFIWARAVKDSSSVKKVLLTRGITIGHDSPAIRKGIYKKQHMLVFAMTEPGDAKVLAVQRMQYDHETYKKTGRGAMFGKNGDGDNFCKGRGVFFYRKQPVDDFITGEGIETVLSGMQVMSMNGCACLSTSGMVGISLPEGVKNLYVLVDSDKKYGGQKASISLAQKYKNKIDNIFLVSPGESCFTDEPEKQDLNDLLMADNTGGSIKERFGAAININDLSWEPPTGKNDPGDAFLPAETLTELNKLNENHAAVLMAGKFRVLKESFDEKEGRHSLSFLTMPDFFNFYRNKKVFVEQEGGPKKAVPIGKLWLDWDGRKTYEDVVFDPTNTCGDNAYNMFKGLTEPKQGEWGKMLAHTREIICDNNEEYFLYLMAWLARAVQEPGGDRPGVAVALKGGKGIGKSAWVDYFGQIFGESYFPISDSGNFTGRFNMHLSKALLVFLDEAIWGGDKKSEGKMKTLITNPYTMFEPKGIDSITMKNFMNIIIASNEDWIVPATGDERRFFVLDINGKYRQNKDYFNAFFHEMNNGGPAAMMYDLLRYDYSGVNLRNAPMTIPLTEQIEFSLPIVWDFWLSVLNRGFLLADRTERNPTLTVCENEPEIWPLTAWKYEVYNEFQNWCTNKREKYISAEQPFWKKTWDVWPDGYPGRKQKRQEGKMLDFLRLPSLKDFKAAFTEVTTIEFEALAEAEAGEPDTDFGFGGY